MEPDREQGFTVVLAADDTHGISVTYEYEPSQYTDNNLQQVLAQRPHESENQDQASADQEVTECADEQLDGEMSVDDEDEDDDDEGEGEEEEEEEEEEDNADGSSIDKGDSEPGDAAAADPDDDAPNLEPDFDLFTLDGSRRNSLEYAASRRGSTTSELLRASYRHVLKVHALRRSSLDSLSSIRSQNLGNSASSPPLSPGLGTSLPSREFIMALYNRRRAIYAEAPAGEDEEHPPHVEMLSFPEASTLTARDIRVDSYERDRNKYPSTLSEEGTAPSVSEVMDGHNDEEAEEMQTLPLCHVDFIPTRTESGRYEPFSKLLEYANEWLMENPQFAVRTCESIEICKRLDDMGYIDCERTTFVETGEFRNKYLRGLRMWIYMREDERKHPIQHLKVLTVIPHRQRKGNRDLSISPKFDNFDDTIAKFNELLQMNPLEGRILNIETQDLLIDDPRVVPDAEVTYWEEVGRYRRYYVNVIRVYYEDGPAFDGQIGYKDFLPDQIRAGGLMSDPIYEPVLTLMTRARQWLCSTTDVNFISIQSINYKLKRALLKEERLDTNKTSFYEAGKGSTFYIQILRLYYSYGGEQMLYSPILSYRTFMPAPLTKPGGCRRLRYECLTDAVDRAAAWIYHTGVQVIGVETLPMRLYGGNQHGNPEQTFTWNSGEGETWLYVVRAYFDGDFTEPSPEVLPPLPEPKEACMCLLQ